MRRYILGVALVLALAGCTVHRQPPPVPVTTTTHPVTTTTTHPVTTTVPVTAPPTPTWINPPTSSGIGKG